MKRKEHEPMHNHTTWKIGGPVDLMLQPESVEELQLALLEAKSLGKPCYIIGAGSNLLIARITLQEIIGGSIQQAKYRLGVVSSPDKTDIVNGGKKAVEQKDWIDKARDWGRTNI